MTIKEVFVSSIRVLPGLAICCLITSVIGVGNVISQETNTVKNEGESVLAVSTFNEIPEGTGQCTPAECNWWTQLREAGVELQHKGNEKSKRKFVTLFVEGLEKSYRIPLNDRGPQVLSAAQPAPPKPRVRMKNGKVSLSIEYRADGSVGEVKIVEGLRQDMDKSCVQATRKNIFLPAVKDGVFVTEWQNGSCGFHSRNGIN